MSIEFNITHVQDIRPDICQFFLRPINQSIEFKPGQYLMLHLPNGEKAPFSMANDDPSNIEFHLRHQPQNPMSLHFLEQIKSQKTIQVSGPFGDCLLPEKIDKPLVFVAGGTGISPHKALITSALKRPDCGDVYLYWGISKPEDEYLTDWLQACRQHKNFHDTLVLSTQNPSWDQAKGLVHEYLLNHHQDLNHCITYASGPYEMAQALKQGFDKKAITGRLLCDMV